jgi:hypothetical protein
MFDSTREGHVVTYLYQSVLRWQTDFRLRRWETVFDVSAASAHAVFTSNEPRFSLPQSAAPRDKSARAFQQRAPRDTDPWTTLGTPATCTNDDLLCAFPPLTFANHQDLKTPV